MKTNKPKTSGGQGSPTYLASIVDGSSLMGPGIRRLRRFALVFSTQPSEKAGAGWAIAEPARGGIDSTLVTQSSSYLGEC